MNKDSVEMKNCTHQQTELLSYHLLYTVEWIHFAIFQNVPVSIQITHSFKFGIKIKRTFTFHYMLLTNITHFWENWTFISVQELFYWVNKLTKCDRSDRKSVTSTTLVLCNNWIQSSELNPFIIYHITQLPANGEWVIQTNDKIKQILLFTHKVYTNKP